MGTRGLALSKALARSDVLGVLGSLVLVGLWIQTALLRLLRSRHSSADANLKLGMSDIDRNSFPLPLTFVFGICLTCSQVLMPLYIIGVSQASVAH